MGGERGSRVFTLSILTGDEALAACLTLEEEVGHTTSLIATKS
jgi:ArsR family metal-binding transcriptional regulator